MESLSNHAEGPPPDSTCCNIELKARFPDLKRGCEVAESLKATRIPDQRQCDTYFTCPNGRLKLREINDETAELIWYARPDENGPKSSQYYVVPIENGNLLRSALQSAWGIRAIVRKHRIVYLYQNVRIHLDQVDGLGCFLEFEAVLDPTHRQDEGRQLVETLRQAFGIASADLLEGSYGEMQGLL